MKNSIVCTFLYLCATTTCFGFDDINTHPIMTEKAVVSPNTIIDNVLRNNLGMNNGINQQLKNSTIDGARAGETYSVLYWLRNGSTDEDSVPTTCRASNHFHNPLKTWDHAGLSGYQGPVSLLVDARCSSTPYTQKNSNVVWATGYLSPSPDGLRRYTNNDMAWYNARTFYKDALTASSKTDRETNFANTFYALGHVLHLLQDTAVPAHVRNDFRSHLDNLVMVEA